MKKFQQLSTAFSLLELSIIITGASLLLVGGIYLDDYSKMSNRFLETEKKIKAIEIAVAAYYAKNEYFPCPSDPLINIRNRSVGASKKVAGVTSSCDISIVSSDGNFYAGGVPTKELGLSYDFMLDGWGNKFAFIVPSEVNIETSVNVPSSIASIPLNYTNLIVWMDAADLSTITKDSSDNISQIDDKSGNGYHLKQSSSSYKPAFVNDLNYPAIQFDGSNDRLYIDSNYYTNASEISQLTVFVAFKTTASAKQVFVGYDGGEYWRIGLSSNGKFEYKTASYPYLSSNPSGNKHYLVTSSSGYRDGNIHYLAATFDKDVSIRKKIYIDGVNVASANASNSSNGIGSGVTRYGYIGTGSEATSSGGAVNSIASYVNGNIYEILIYENSFTSTEMSVLHNYLEDKWQNGYAAYNDSGPFLTIKDIDGSVIEDEAVFSIISFGSTGRGSYSKGGAANDRNPVSYNILTNGFDSQNIITDYMLEDSKLVKRKGFKEGFGQLVRYFTISDIQNIIQ
ncbi:MAG: hypothetical protein HOM96_05895 [Rickettsiales bacterium]|nr:hypothetical protein [Rickettsiales bacterium]